MQPEPTAGHRIGVGHRLLSLTRTLLEMDSVPANAIIALPQTVTSTFDEARVLTDWAKQNNAHLFFGSDRPVPHAAGAMDSCARS